MTKYAPGKEQHKAKKSLGQNFLVDSTVCPRIAEKAQIDGIGVLEIGPGFGALTVELARRAEKVVAIEIDEDVIPQLLENLSEFSNVTVIQGDAMETDLRSLIEVQFGDMPVAIVGNLPYYITSPVIMALLESKLPIEAVTVMVQKEAAQRICAPVGSRLSGAVTVAVDYYADAYKLFDVSAGSFMPAPKVDSCVIRMDIRKKPEIEITDEKLFFKIVHAAFGQRRKTASNSISSGSGIPKDVVIRAIEECGFEPSVRAETLNMQNLADLCEKISLLMKKE